MCVLEDWNQEKLITRRKQWLHALVDKDEEFDKDEEMSKFLIDNPVITAGTKFKEVMA